MRPAILGLLAALVGCGGTSAKPLDAALPPDAALAAPDASLAVPDAAGPDALAALPDAAVADAAPADAAPATVPPFLSTTSGGAHLGSSHYRLDLFVAPVSPSGATASTQHRLRLGPAAARRP